MMVALAMVVGTVAPAHIKLYNRKAKAVLSTDQSGSGGLIQISGVGPYASIVTYDGKGRLKLDFNSLPQCTFAPYASGLNPDSENYLVEILVIHNAGPETYKITLKSKNPRVKFFTSPGNWWPVVGPKKKLTLSLPSGWNWLVGVYVDARGLGTGVTISAVIEVEATNP
ncbi:DUF1102 domain-containing protein [Candidatus Bathyarchaeota archaeon]|nr:DUF1102 domain-containing protein [Candidatus Bathyarchaeota archaeon]